MNVPQSLLKVKPRIQAPLDPGFIPPVLANGIYRQAVQASPVKEKVRIALERENKLICRADVEILPLGIPSDADTLKFVERHIKFLVWSRGGWKLHLSGPEPVCRHIREAYKEGGARAFDAALMQKVYEHPFAVTLTESEKVPDAREATSSIGGHLDGCRIGFDLGASDYKLAAVVDGKAIFSTEIPWQPSTQKDPAYHYDRILKGLKEAASKMPRLDAIGGSSAGVFVDNQVKVASLFRSIPEEIFHRQVKTMFQRLQKEFGVPLVVINDGDVSALAGAMSLGKNAMLGMAMGSSEATGFLNRQGGIPGYLNELAFCPVDFNAEAPAEEWSGDQGVGALYFSQQAVNKLAPAAGLKFPDDMLLPERLKAVQEKVQQGHSGAEQIFETIGVYLGYTIPHYAEYYDLSNLLILGRVTSGKGGDIIIGKAREVLKSEFPEISKKVALHVPDEKSRRVGQAVAAASLPEISA